MYLFNNLFNITCNFIREDFRSWEDIRLSVLGIYFNFKKIFLLKIFTFIIGN